MTHSLKFAGLRASLVVSALAFGACNGADQLTNASDGVTDTPVAQPVASSDTVAFATAVTSNSGTPFGTYHMPPGMYNATFTGGLKVTTPGDALTTLAAAKRAGTKIFLAFVGNESHYKNADGTFSLDKWKARLGPMRGVNFSSYIADGTIIAHYLIDEPNDAANWNGTVISPATLDEMARYSKSLWPGMATVVRAKPAYFKGYTYKYLDAAWAQYAGRFGDPVPWIAANVRDAKAAGLALVAGVNQLAGGTKETGGLYGYYQDKYAMSAAHLISTGSALLADPYVCAFISWQYNQYYMGRPDIKAALATLSQKAHQHAFRACRSGAPIILPPPPGPTPPPTPTPPPSVRVIPLKAVVHVEPTRRYVLLTWSNAVGATVDVYRNGTFAKNVENKGIYANLRRQFGAYTFVYQVCEKGSSRCSNKVTAVLR